jgi:hypothetical protein
MHHTTPFFEERIATCMFISYIFYAPRKKYHQLGELWLNMCGDIVTGTKYYKIKN